jgi:hypothetical protein
MWRRIVNLFHRKPCPAHAKAVEAVFAQNLTAQVRAGEAAASVTRSSDQTRHHLQRLRREIAERTDADRFTRPQPHTSDVRSLVETVLTRVQPRPDQKG